VNTRTHTYPVTGSSGNGARVSLSNYTSGDAKWYPNNIGVTPGRTYRFSDFYSSNVSSEIDIEFTLSNGSKSYLVLGNPAPASGFQNFTAEFTVPANVVSLTVFHLISENGTLSVDEYSLNEVSLGGGGGNLVPNGTLESGSTAPTAWSKGGWGNNTRVHTYPTAGVGGSRGATVAITNYTSGDAKWYFNPISVPGGLYTYSNQYKSNIPSVIDVQFRHANGSFSYVDLKHLPPANAFTPVTVDFTVPPGVQDITIFHLIQGVGSLTVDDVSIVPKTGGGIFTTGAVTLTFDDGLFSQYQHALPALSNSGLTATFYIVSRELFEHGFSGKMSTAQVKNLFNAGMEIGAHTQTHPHLPQLSQAVQQQEISGSRQDLLALNVGPINSFAYPFGDYNAAVLQKVESAGFTNARSTINGSVLPTTDIFQLPRIPVNSNTTFAQIKQQIDLAATNKQWLILVFHAIDTSGQFYSTTPTILNQIISYLAQKGIPVVTMEEGSQDIQ
jgi:peptidoglycan/xylan/chitin deacetylase (PgdA/CDA1 family)